MEKTKNTKNTNKTHRRGTQESPSPAPAPALITYMGNKRKLLPHIQQIIQYVYDDISNGSISFADPFSGSGAVSQLAFNSNLTSHIISNDIALYSHITNLAFLSSPSEKMIQQINSFIDTANNLPPPLPVEEFVAKHWAPKNDHNILPGERCYFTRENALIIDSIRNFIASNSVPEKYKPYLLAHLLIKASIHNNTNGQFAAFYKDENGTGAFGGKKEVDLKRITQKIVLPHYQYISNTLKTPKNVTLTNKDALQWTKDLAQIHTQGECEGLAPPIDLVYLDPPYNKHPYNIYYFLLDIIAKWDKNIDIPNTYRGQPKNWTRSPFNSSIDAHSAIQFMIENIPAKYIALSYYDHGILSISQIDTLLEKYGQVQKFPINYAIYNRLHGIGNYSRSEAPNTSAKEYMWLLKKTQLSLSSTNI